MAYVTNFLLIIISSLCVITHGMETNDKQKKIAHANQALLNATQEDNVAQIIKLIKEKIADINTRNDNNDTPLICAARMNRINAVKILLTAGANPNLMNEYSATALTYALRNCNNETIVTLLDPIISPMIQKKMETIIMIYNGTTESELSKVPREIVDTIITYACPEYALNHAWIRCLDPHILIDIIPLQTVAWLIKHQVLTLDRIIEAWKTKIQSMAEDLSNQRNVNNSLHPEKMVVGHDAIEQFKINTPLEIQKRLT